MGVHENRQTDVELFDLRLNARPIILRVGIDEPKNNALTCKFIAERLKRFVALAYDRATIARGEKHHRLGCFLPIQRVRTAFVIEEAEVGGGLYEFGG